MNRLVRTKLFSAKIRTKLLAKCCTLTILAAATVSGCGKKDFGEFLGVQLTPSDNNVVNHGPLSTCLDLATFKATGLSLGKSAPGPLVTFTQFILYWKKAQELNIQAIRVTVEGTGVKDGKYETTINSNEVEALVGYESSVVPASVAAGAIPAAPLVISSYSTSRDSASSKFAKCGLIIPSIPLTDGDKTSDFRMKITVEVIATTIDSNGNASLVRQHTTGYANYYTGT